MKILELIKNHIVATQEELAERLREAGIKVTQATVSRDIKDLNLVKVPVGDGRYRYALPQNRQELNHVVRLRRVFRECLVSLDYSENLIAVKALSATAPGVAEAIDSLGWEEIIGTVAGDNTVLVVVKPTEATPSVAARLEKFAR